jgi:WD40 repeat protein
MKRKHSERRPRGIQLWTSLATSAILCARAALAAAHGQTIGTRSKSASQSGAITVDEGTNMALSASPDHKILMIDLQGMLYTLPIGGGKAKRITSPELEASHPGWSPKGDLVAIQSYSGGTFHIWTMNRMDRRCTRSPPATETTASRALLLMAGPSHFRRIAHFRAATTSGRSTSTGKLKQWTSGADDEYEPTLVNGWHKIAFVSGAGAIARTIQTIDTEGKKETVASVPENSVWRLRPGRRTGRRSRGRSSAARVGSWMSTI